MDTTLAQINARIDSNLKVSGDAALAKAGLTPTKAIRSMWGLFSSLADRPDKIRELVSGQQSESSSAACAERDRKLTLAREGSQIVARSLASRGISVSEGFDEPSYDELREQVLLERLRERGLDS
ncbi:MAG TPA: hypothetical protein IAA42_05555 [Candidatus Olsenella excrementavium]|uniref:Uncharacterized protein n=1 Tax=Candidatus Olsenella excrementavium TaxID=2838709 RepID=A0A9D1ZBC0_9ACTN|nr:hypothetical protein [Candidatus Olsenella excrementavium]